jgi:hypothetical protein
MGYYKYIQEELNGVKKFKKIFIKDEKDYDYDLEVMRILNLIADEELAKTEEDKTLFLQDIVEDSPEKEDFLSTLEEKKTKITTEKLERADKKVEVEAKKAKAITDKEAKEAKAEEDEKK